MKFVNLYLIYNSLYKLTSQDDFVAAYKRSTVIYV